MVTIAKIPIHRIKKNLCEHERSIERIIDCQGCFYILKIVDVERTDRRIKFMTTQEMVIEPSAFDQDTPAP